MTLTPPASAAENPARARGGTTTRSLGPSACVGFGSTRPTLRSTVSPEGNSASRPAALVYPSRHYPLTFPLEHVVPSDYPAAPAASPRLVSSEYPRRAPRRRRDATDSESRHNIRVAPRGRRRRDTPRRNLHVVPRGAAANPSRKSMVHKLRLGESRHERLSRLGVFSPARYAARAGAAGFFLFGTTSMRSIWTHAQTLLSGAIT